MARKSFADVPGTNALTITWSAETVCPRTILKTAPIGSGRVAEVRSQRLGGSDRRRLRDAATLAIVPDIRSSRWRSCSASTKFMSECLDGNAVAAIVISRWEGELDRDKLHATIKHPITVKKELEAQPV